MTTNAFSRTPITWLPFPADTSNLGSRLTIALNKPAMLWCRFNNHRPLITLQRNPHDVLFAETTDFSLNPASLFTLIIVGRKNLLCSSYSILERPNPIMCDKPSISSKAKRTVTRELWISRVMRYLFHQTILPIK